MKKVLIIGLVLISIFIIYLTTIDREIYYLALGDDITTIELENSKGYSNYINDYLEYYDKLEIYINEFSKENYRITDIISDINNNKKVMVNDSEKTLKNALIKADLLTLSIGMNDLTSKINAQNITNFNNFQDLYDDVDEITNDLEKLLILLRQYCKEEIFLIGVYYPYQIQNQQLNKVFEYYNTRFKELAGTYQIRYIDIYDIFSENQAYLSDSTIYPSQEGLEIIASQIIVTINNTVLKNSWFSKKRLL